MGINEDRKRFGRYIKRNDPILKYVKVTDFRLEEVNKFDTLICDNTANSIIHTRLHLEDDMDRSVRKYEYEKNDITPKDSQRPVLIPLDFTDDWERMRARSTKKQIFLDDEDYFFFEAMEKEKKKRAGDTGVHQDASHAFDVGEDEGEFPQDLQQDQDDNSIKSDLDRENDLLIEQPVVSSRIDENEMLKSVASVLPKDSDSFQGTGLVVGSRHKEQPDPVIEPVSSDEKPAMNTEMSVQTESELPPSHSLDSDSHSVDKDLEQEIYKEGFEQGVHAAHEELKAEFATSMNKVTEMMVELEGLKKDILHNAHDNFTAISKAMMESLLRREYKINAKALSDVIARAIDESVPADHYRIRVNPQSREELSALASPDLAGRLVDDETLAEGDFKIESETTVIDGKVGQVVSDLIKQAGSNLFGQDDQLDESQHNEGDDANSDQGEDKEHKGAS